MDRLEFILASGSPRRREILARVGLFPTVEAPDVDETQIDGETPGEYVERLARSKAQRSARLGRVVLAADTSVAVDGEVLGKPDTDAQARTMLASLQGRRHEVHTGVAVAVTLEDGETVVHSDVEVTEVSMEAVSDERLDWYVSTGESSDKAGGYGLQGTASLFADDVSGSVTSVIGLPLPLTDRLFAQHGLDLLGFRSDPPIDAVETIAQMALRQVTVPPTRSDPVVRWASAEDIAKDFEEVGLEIDGQPASQEALIAAAETLVDRSVHTNHPYFLNQNWAGSDPLAVAGDWLSAALNTTNATFEVAPAFTVIERALMAKMAEMVGFPLSDQHPAGIMCAGGALAQLHAMQLARHRYQPSLVQDGADGKPARILVSDMAHYSTEKAAVMMGMGRGAVQKIATTPSGAMDVDALDSALGQGDDVIAIVATAGTTVTGAFDPIDAIADRCEERNIWLHIDGAYGGAALMSPEHKWRFKGASRADSLLWNLHKMAGITQQASVLLLREPERLLDTFATGADYIFQPDKANATLDPGDRTLQCGRRPDGFKAWLSWKARGDAGMAAIVDHAVSLADRARTRIAERDDLAMIVPGDFTAVCLTWVPPEMRPFDLSKLSDSDRQALHQLAPAAKAEMQAAGSALIGYQPVRGLNCFRLIFTSPAVNEDDVDVLLDIIADTSALAWKA